MFAYKNRSCAGACRAQGCASESVANKLVGQQTICQIKSRVGDSHLQNTPSGKMKNHHLAKFVETLCYQHNIPKLRSIKHKIRMYTRNDYGFTSAARIMSAKEISLFAISKHSSKALRTHTNTPLGCLGSFAKQMPHNETKHRPQQHQGRIIESEQGAHEGPDSSTT